MNLLILAIFALPVGVFVGGVIQGLLSRPQSPVKNQDETLDLIPEVQAIPVPPQEFATYRRFHGKFSNN
jgi:hypothetical protein